jgi:hypothetical protein
MSAFGPKQTWASYAISVAIGGKADIPSCAAHVCFDPKRTFRAASLSSFYAVVMALRAISPAAAVARLSA